VLQFSSVVFTGCRHMSEVQQLYQLQGLDSEIQEKRKRLGEVLNAQKETEEVISARIQASEAADGLKRLEARQRELNLELESLVSKSKRSEDRLYSGKVTNPKELTDLQNELDSLGRRRASLEEDLIELMIAVEDAEVDSSTADQLFSSIRSEWEQSQVELRRQQNELALRLHDLGEEREQQVGLISAALLAKYTSISQRRGGLAVVHLRGNICQGCQLNVSANRAKDALEGKLVLCDNCDRILTRKWTLHP